MSVTLDYVGDQETMVYAQLGQQPLARMMRAPLLITLLTEASMEPG